MWYLFLMLDIVAKCILQNLYAIIQTCLQFVVHFLKTVTTVNYFRQFTVAFEIQYNTKQLNMRTEQKKEKFKQDY